AAGDVQRQAGPVVTPRHHVDAHVPAALGREGLERLLVRRHRVLVPEAERQRALVPAGAAAGVGAAVPGVTTAVAGGGAGRRRAEQPGGGEGGEESTTVQHGNVLPEQASAPIIGPFGRERWAMCPQMAQALIPTAVGCPPSITGCRPPGAENGAER